MTRFRHARPGHLLSIAVMAALAGCAHQPAMDMAREWDAGSPTGAPSPVDAALPQALRAAEKGQWSVAQAGFTAALRDDLRNPQLQFLNGLAYEQLSRAGDRSKLDLARVGYENAIRFDPGNYWAYLHLGYLELDAGNYSEAQEAFARAVRDQPGRWEAAYGLGVASYYAGDPALARLAAERLQQIDPDHPGTLRLLAFTMATVGDPRAMDLARRLAEVEPGDTIAPRRVGEVLRGVMLAQDTTTPEAWPEAAVDPLALGGGEQVMVDVTIILSSNVQSESRGINLFDGLTLQYGYTNSYIANRASGQEWNSSRSITSNIAIPQLTYSLNLFNNSGQIYQVLARPSLTAYMGRESEFFAGRTVSVGVSGVNLGTLQPIDVGVGLKVTPEAINGNRITFRVSANRSFLSREQVGGFSESLTTFKQLVSATAEVEFGQTLLLSALSEKVRDSTYSKTPGLGDVPGVSLLFNDRSTLQRTESLLVLVTPMRPTTIETREREPAATVEQLRNAWQTWIEPRSEVAAIVDRLQSAKLFSQAESGDLKWRSAQTPQLLDEALKESAQLAAR